MGTCHTKTGMTWANSKGQAGTCPPKTPVSACAHGAIVRGHPPKYLLVNLFGDKICLKITLAFQWVQATKIRSTWLIGHGVAIHYLSVAGNNAPRNLLCLRALIFKG